ncbi:hypothetical protein BABINDRAFT_159009 [Babjeviella inositovora NRRL Y-12698]|uniref:Uncharacterized protein n=1 Tax=Babjeviella inositovora NRRL Y-12698 TaxID=984486 RepID=A0A1E3QXL0_9ASCO|nr:uncharacterized protein BABINDRAFT_159009 [Babjeviella inositovora NRRL Y-12698]ODQ82410.1 hypothetical protein BABINDRAFT_159009 [Babjeviella inositovora NRRL Y-12698]
MTEVFAIRCSSIAPQWEYLEEIRIPLNFSSYLSTPWDCSSETTKPETARERVAGALTSDTMLSIGVLYMNSLGYHLTCHCDNDAGFWMIATDSD